MHSSMTITYRNNFRDRLAFIAYHLLRNPATLVIAIGAFLFFTYETAIPAARSLPTDTPVFFQIIVFILIESLLVFFFVAVWAAFILLAMISRRNKPLYCKRTLTLQDEMYVTESEYGKSETRWQIVQKLVRTRAHIFMYVNQENAVVIPRRAFETPAQWNAFYDFCKQRTSTSLQRD